MSQGLQCESSSSSCSPAARMLSPTRSQEMRAIDTKVEAGIISCPLFYTCELEIQLILLIRKPYPRENSRSEDAFCSVAKSSSRCNSMTGAGRRVWTSQCKMDRHSVSPVHNAHIISGHRKPLGRWALMEAGGTRTSPCFLIVADVFKCVWRRDPLLNGHRRQSQCRDGANMHNPCTDGDAAAGATPHQRGQPQKKRTKPEGGNG